MSAEMTESRFRDILGRMKAIITDRNGNLRSVENALLRGELIQARQLLSIAIKEQLTFVKKYDTTGRIVAQTQELVHIRKELLQGTTWKSCCRLFTNWKATYENVKKDSDSQVVHAVGKIASVACAVGKIWSSQPHNPVEDHMIEIQAARIAGMVYAPVKASIKTLVSTEGKQSFSDVCRGAYQVACSKAETVYAEAKKIAVKAVEKCKTVISGGYQVARLAVQAAKRIALPPVIKEPVKGILNGVRAGWNALVRRFS